MVAWGWELLFCSLFVFPLHWGPDSASIAAALAAQDRGAFWVLCLCAASKRSMQQTGWISAQTVCLLSLLMGCWCADTSTNPCLALAFTLGLSLNVSLTVQSVVPFCASLLLLGCWQLVSAMKSGSLYANNWTSLFLEFFKGCWLVKEGNN